MKVDAYAHILTPRYCEEAARLLGTLGDAQSRAFQLMLAKDPSLAEVRERAAIMDAVGQDYRQVLTMALTSVEYIDRSINVRLARLANNELPELAGSDPARYRGWVAQAPLLDMPETIRELERAFSRGALGAQINTHIAGRALDDPLFEPFFEYMADRRRPIWVHPNRRLSQSEYPDAEESSRYTLYSKTGWPTDTTNAMLRLAYSGVLERWPALRILTHHAGGTIPMIAGRLVEPPREREDLEPTPLLKRLYADTAAFGNPIAVRAAVEFFGEDHVVFGTDFGFTSSFAPRTIDSVKQAILDPAVREKVFHANFERMLGD
ncbi:MAG: amidohydrolase family protein [Microbacterium sp.]|uniref:amidohydrolase family protein n=1 Tax=Microbacterium sp. TaxID=51671 RepID=UPI003F7FE775